MQMASILTHSKNKKDENATNFMSDAVGIYSVLCIMSVISLTESVNL